MALDALDKAEILFSKVRDMHTWPYTRQTMAAVATGTAVVASSLFGRFFNL